MNDQVILPVRLMLIREKNNDNLFICVLYTLVFFISSQFLLFKLLFLIYFLYIFVFLFPPTMNHNWSMIKIDQSNCTTQEQTFPILYYFQNNVGSF